MAKKQTKIDPRYTDMRLNSAWASDIIHQPDKATGLNYTVGYLDPVTKQQPITYSQLLDFPQEVKNKYGVNNTLQPFFNAYKGQGYYGSNPTNHYGQGGPVNEYGLGGTIGGLLGSLIPIPGVGTAVGAALGSGVDAIFANNGQRKGNELEQQRLNDINHKQQQDAINIAQSQTYTNPFAPTFTQGGAIPTRQVELEKKETYMEPDGNVGQVNGPTHAQGGVDMNLDVGSIIWSDKRKSKTGKTFAEETAPLLKQLDKYNKILNV